MKQCVTAQFRCQSSITVFINIFPFFLCDSLSVRFRKKVTRKRRREKSDGFCPLRFWLGAIFIRVCVCVSMCWKYEAITATVFRLPAIIPFGIFSGRWCGTFYHLRWFLCTALRISLCMLFMCLLLLIYKFRYHLRSTMIENEAWVSEKEANREICGYTGSQHVDAESFLGLWKYNLIQSNGMMFASVCVCVCFAGLSVYPPSPFNVFSQNICLSKCNGILAGIERSWMELCMALVCIQTPTHTLASTQLAHAKYRYILLLICLYMNGTLTALIHLRLFHNQNDGASSIELIEASVLVWPWRSIFIPSFSLSLCDGCDCSWAYELTLSVWMSELG